MASLPPPEFLNHHHKRLNSLIYLQGELPTLKVLDQLLVPEKFEYIPVSNVEEAYSVIKKMQVRGAPLIAMTGIIGLLTEAKNTEISDYKQFVKAKTARLIESRPTAVNLRNACEKLVDYVNEGHGDELTRLEKFVNEYYAMEERENRQLCWNGVQAVRELKPKSQDGYTVMTICNTGCLATCSWGTAIGIINGLHDRGFLKRAICLETRPYNQGSRLTATEFSKMDIPFTLITDSMAAAAIQQFGVDIVIVGADQVARNGDTANKIGTCNLSIVSKHFNVPVIVALPMDTFNPSIESGDSITIEERPADEMRQVNGKYISLPDCPVWNPAFDITPNELIYAHVTEKGVHKRADRTHGSPAIN